MIVVKASLVPNHCNSASFAII